MERGQRGERERHSGGEKEGQAPKECFHSGPILVRRVKMSSIIRTSKSF